MPIQKSRILTYEEVNEYKRLVFECEKESGSWEEIGEMLRLTPKTIRSRMQDNGVITYEALLAMKWVHHLLMIVRAKRNSPGGKK